MNLHDGSGRDVVMLTGTRDKSPAMNRLTRRSWNAAGRLSGPNLVAGRLFKVGERIICLRNDPSFLHGGYVRDVTNERSISSSTAPPRPLR